MKEDIRCLACNISVYPALEDYRRPIGHKPWDWDRQLCGPCDSLIPDHIPMTQSYRYMQALVRKDKYVCAKAYLR